MNTASHGHAMIYRIETNKQQTDKRALDGRETEIGKQREKGREKERREGSRETGRQKKGGREWRMRL